jgi:orotidine-5'-phosphate decarboxylase
MAKAPIALAMDTFDLSTVKAWARAVAPTISTVKIGLELYLRHGRPVIDSIRDVAPDLDIFLDLKLHDIPNTVAGATKSVADLHPKFLTVHALGGADMIQAAVDAAPEIMIAAVTILTSHSESDLQMIGLNRPPHEHVSELAQMAVSSGARALVCSPAEVERLRSLVGDDVELITPGIRPVGSQLGDQKRVATPQQALDSGASLLVIGRPITELVQSGGEEAVARAAAAISADIQVRR